MSEPARFYDHYDAGTGTWFVRDRGSDSGDRIVAETDTPYWAEAVALALCEWFGKGEDR